MIYGYSLNLSNIKYEHFLNCQKMFYGIESSQFQRTCQILGVEYHVQEFSEEIPW